MLIETKNCEYSIQKSWIERTVLSETAKYVWKSSHSKIIYMLSQISISRDNRSEKMHSSASILGEKEQWMCQKRQRKGISSRDNSLTTRRKYRNDRLVRRKRAVPGYTIKALAMLRKSSSRFRNWQWDRHTM